MRKYLTLLLFGSLIAGMNLFNVSKAQNDWLILKTEDISLEFHRGPEKPSQSAPDALRRRAAADAACACRWQRASGAWPDSESYSPHSAAKRGR